MVAEVVAFGKFINDFIAKHPSLESRILLKAPDDRALACCYEGFLITQTPIEIPDEGQRNKLIQHAVWHEITGAQLNQTAQTGKYPGYQRAAWNYYHDPKGTFLSLYYCPTGRSDAEINTFILFVESMATKYSDIPLEVLVENADPESQLCYRRLFRDLIEATEARGQRCLFTSAIIHSRDRAGKESQPRDLGKDDAKQSAAAPSPST